MRKFPNAYLLCLFLLLGTGRLTAQCPPNIDFESGSFQHWECVTGKAASGGVLQNPVIGEVTGRHTLMRRSEVGHIVDPFGKFPLASPDGSEYFVKLGNHNNGAQADRISYTFTVPANQQDYSLMYNYAVVVENPNHGPNEQPRFTSKVLDVATNEYVTCASFDIVSSSDLPGFASMDTFMNDAWTTISYKSWSAVTIKLLGYAGKTIRVEFTTFDCAPAAHFGYAYLDVNLDCGPPVKGNVYCQNQTSTTLVSPLGYKEYYWYDDSFTTLFGTNNILELDPIPPSGTLMKLVVVPYESSGCRDTLNVTITAKSSPFDFNVISPVLFCNPSLGRLSIMIDPGNTPGLRYTYWHDPEMLRPVFEPEAVKTNGTYYIRAVNDDGCLGVKPVVVDIGVEPAFSIINPLPVSYVGPANLMSPSIISGNIGSNSVSYWRDDAATIPLLNPGVVDVPGTYYIKVGRPGCSVTKPVTVISGLTAIPNIFSPNGDGVHDRWDIPYLSNLTYCTVDIYNRYGQPVHRTTGYANAWDGKVNGKLVPVGTYYYMIHLDKRFPPISGYVDVIY